MTISIEHCERLSFSHVITTHELPSMLLPAHILDRPLCSCMMGALPVVYYEAVFRNFFCTGRLYVFHLQQVFFTFYLFICFFICYSAITNWGHMINVSSFVPDLFVTLVR